MGGDLGIGGGRLREPLSDFDGEIYAIYLAVDAQRRGCGRTMMQQLAGKLLQDGLANDYAVVLVLGDPARPCCIEAAQAENSRRAEGYLIRDVTS